MTDLMNEFLEAEDRNDHTGATMIINSAIGGKLSEAYAVVLQEIKDRHELAGYMQKNDQVLRDAIQSDVLNTARIMGLI